MLSYLMGRGGVTAGWLTLAICGIALVSYALGCCNGAVMVSRLVLKDDIRKHGSGNGGLTNFCRIHGGALSVVVIAIDMLKAVVSILVAGYIFSAFAPNLCSAAKYWAALWCILGHMFPITYQFKGGKGVLSSGTIALMLDWRLALLIWGCFIICAVATKYVSLGSCVGALAFPVGSILIYNDPIITVISIVMGALVLFKHRGNLHRLFTGTESKFVFKTSFKRDKDGAGPEAEAAPAAVEETVEAAETAAPADEQEESQV